MMEVRFDRDCPPDSVYIENVLLRDLRYIAVHPDTWEGMSEEARANLRRTCEQGAVDACRKFAADQSA